MSAWQSRATNLPDCIPSRSCAIKSDDDPSACHRQDPPDNDDACASSVASTRSPRLAHGGGVFSSTAGSASHRSRSPSVSSCGDDVDDVDPRWLLDVKGNQQRSFDRTSTPLPLDEFGRSLIRYRQERLESSNFPGLVTPVMSEVADRMQSLIEYMICFNSRQSEYQERPPHDSSSDRACSSSSSESVVQEVAGLPDRCLSNATGDLGLAPTAGDTGRQLRSDLGIPDEGVRGRCSELCSLHSSDHRAIG